MADYYTETSFEVDFKTTKNAIDFVYVLDSVDFTLAEREYRDADDPFALLINELIRALEDDYSVGFRYEQRDTKVWFSHDYSANIESLITVLECAMQHWDLDPIGFEWSNTCSKPRLDAFGGGAAYITKERTETMNTYQWLQSMEQPRNDNLQPPV